MPNDDKNPVTPEPKTLAQELSEIPQEGNEPVEEITEPEPKEEEKEEEAPAESQPAEEPKEEQPESGEKEEDNLPFHKHPRFTKIVHKLKEFEEKDALNQKQISEMKAELEKSKNAPPASVEAPQWFKDQYGDDTSAWKTYSENVQKYEESIIEKAIARIEQKNRSREEENSKWKRLQDVEMDVLEEKGNDFDRNELVAWMLKNPIIKPDGTYDFEKSLEFMNLQKSSQAQPPKTNVKKQIAAKTAPKPSTDPKTDVVIPASKIRKMGWDDITL